MSNNLKRVIEKIKSGNLAIGTAISLAYPVIAEIYCDAGYDWIWIDSEHGPIDKKDIDMLIMTIRKSGVAPFVRIPWTDPVLAKPILDMGAAGIIFPLVKTVEDAKLAVKSCKYPPMGERGFGPRRAIDYGIMSNDEYLNTEESEPWVILQIEHIDGVNNLEDILKVDGVDCIAIGPCDLSGSMGLLGQTDHPQVVEQLDKIAKICNKAKIPFGPSVGTSNLDLVKTWINRGASLFQGDCDIMHLTSASKKTYEIIKKTYSELK